jgi:2-polyprenyl-3-methyl-5-hydroxy-6-metoxy-1,4-benzoquinol methylase
MSPVRDYEAPVKACYSSWSRTYYDEYYGPGAPYPPVHRDLLLSLLRKARIKTLLDAGCGPASFLRHMDTRRLKVYGFDLTPEMVDEARRVLAPKGVPPDRIWQGSVLSPRAFKAPGGKAPKLFDAITCAGVFPHIPPEADTTVIRNLRQGVKKNGLVIVEARNLLFSLFTLNRYSFEFFTDELIRAADLQKKAGNAPAALSDALEDVRTRFRMDLPPVREGKASAPGYDEVLSRMHNPFVIREQFERLGFKDVRLFFYHFHALPPMCQRHLPELFRAESIAMENPEDWRGHFMASAFLLSARRA